MNGSKATSQCKTGVYSMGVRGLDHKHPVPPCAGGFLRPAFHQSSEAADVR